MPLPQFHLATFFAALLPTLTTATAMSSPKLPPAAYRPPIIDNPLRISRVLLSLGIEIVALAIPLPRLVQQAVVFPAILRLDAQMLWTGSPSVVVSYVIGMAVAYQFYQMLDVFFWSDPRTYVRYDPNELVEERKEEGAGKGGRGDGKAKRRSVKGQGLPKTFRKRLSWILSMVFAMRHVGWNLEADDELQVPTEKLEPKAFLKDRWPRFLFHYLTLDAMVYYVRHIDSEYFQPLYDGLSSVGTVNPHPRLPSFYPTVPADTVMNTILHNLAYIQRIALQTLSIWSIISAIYFALSILFVGLPLLFRKNSTKPGYWTHPRSWPPLFTTFSLSDGLIGFWGKEWHALFRRIFSSPSTYFNLENGARGLVAFTISASLHALGAWTNSRRGLGSGGFFLLQAAGVSVEASARSWLKKRCGVTVRNSEVLRAGLAVWSFVFLTVTATVFFDEYRTGGLWTLEPVPFSLWLRPGEFLWAPWSAYGLVW